MNIATADSAFLRALVRERSGIVLGDDKDYLLESRLQPLARSAGLADLAALVAALRSDPSGALARQTVEAMTTNETFFFRDVHPFACLRQEVLPALATRRATQRRLDLWCAAAATGQEPYTIAMILRELFPQGGDWTLRLLATDLADTVLERARAGRYSQLEVNRGLPAAMLVRWFAKDGPDWVVKDDLRRMIEFRRQNLLEPLAAGGPFDVIFIRNVLIYFDVETKKAILGRCRRLLRPDGYLFLGGAETTLNLDDAFERMAFDRGGCYRLKPA